MPSTQRETKRQKKLQPLVIYATREFDGYTYQLHPDSQDRVRTKDNPQRTFPRIFISQDTKQDFEALLEPIAPELVVLLTGLRQEQVKELGGAQFQDSGTEKVLFTWPPARS